MSAETGPRIAHGVAASARSDTHIDTPPPCAATARTATEAMARATIG
jgi:hypothetical protein